MLRVLLIWHTIIGETTIIYRQFSPGVCAVLKLMRVLVVLIALGMLLAAIGFMFYPWMMQSDFAVEASRIDGMGTIRGDLGGLFLMLSMFTFYGCLPRKTQWLAVPILFMLTVMLGRTIHILIDGVTDAALRSLIVEFVLLLILLLARSKLAAQKLSDIQ